MTDSLRSEARVPPFDDRAPWCTACEARMAYAGRLAAEHAHEIVWRCPSCARFHPAVSPAFIEPVCWCGARFGPKGCPKATGTGEDAVARWDAA